MSRSTVIHVDQVCKSYGGRQVLKDISVEVGQGEFFGVFGPNGAGKTTLIEIMEGLRRADDGTVSVFGYQPWQRDRTTQRRIGVHTQKAAFFPRLTAIEHLQTVAALYGVDRDRARQVLELVGLADSSGSAVEKLSGGQRQRLAIASMLTHEPELLFLDEPTAALDPQARRGLWETLRGIRSSGRTIVYTTHHMDEAEALCDRVAIIRSGELVALDSPVNLIRRLDAPTRVLVPRDRLAEQQARGIAAAEGVWVTSDSTVITTRDVGRVLTSLAEVIDLKDIQTRTATLEDVYLELTGTEYRP